MINRLRRLPVVRNLLAARFRRLVPFRRGSTPATPIVRYYHENFLQRHRGDLRGRCLEIGDTRTIRRLAEPGMITAEALDVTAHNGEVTVVADLSRADHVAANQFDCFLNQFTMTVVYDVEAALYHSVRIVRPGGVLLVNFGCIDYYLHAGLDMGTGKPLYMYNWFTPIQIDDLMHRLGLTKYDYEMTVYGNLLTRIAFQLNMSADELTPRELDTVDPGHPVLACVRIQKPADWNQPPPAYREVAYTPRDEPIMLHASTGHYGTSYL